MCLSLTFRSTIAQPETLSSCETLASSLCVVMRTKSTHSKKKSFVCHQSVIVLGRFWVKGHLPPANSLQIDLLSHFAFLKQSHVQQWCYAV